MSTKADYNAEEWETVVDGPPIAGLIVVTAESGRLHPREPADGEGVQRGQAGAPRSESDRRAAQLPARDQPARLRRRRRAPPPGLEQLGEAVAILEAKGDQDEVDSYRGFVMGIAERVAHAHKTGGFLGFGGHEVSENEQLALEEIREAIGAHPVPDSEEE